MFVGTPSMRNSAGAVSAVSVSKPRLVETITLARRESKRGLV
jgi:hypothetical protein